MMKLKTILRNGQCTGLKPLAVRFLRISKTWLEVEVEPWRMNFLGPGNPQQSHIRSRGQKVKARDDPRASDVRESLVGFLQPINLIVIFGRQSVPLSHTVKNLAARFPRPRRICRWYLQRTLGDDARASEGLASGDWAQWQWIFRWDRCFLSRCDPSTFMLLVRKKT